MNTSMPNAGGPAFYTIREAAWVLGVDRATISRAVRIGTVRAVVRRSRLVIPAAELARLLGGTSPGRPRW